MNSLEKYLIRKEKIGSYLCTGIDPDPEKIPSSFGKNLNGIYNFCEALIEASHQFTIAYKINFAFFEQFGPNGYGLIEKVQKLIPQEILSVADAKRGDIGNTAKAYAKSIFDYFNFDSVTINPYMGFDTAEAFLNYEDKYSFVLALTSNPGSKDFQMLSSDGEEIYKKVIGNFSRNKRYNNCGYVFGATNPSQISQARNILNKISNEGSNEPNHLKKNNSEILLIPGIGAQGGDIDAVLEKNAGGNALINVSRGVSYPEGIKEARKTDEIKKLIGNKAQEYSLLLNDKTKER